MAYRGPLKLNSVISAKGSDEEKGSYDSGDSSSNEKNDDEKEKDGEGDDYGDEDEEQKSFHEKKDEN